ncbi:MAG: FliH/SctL family protein [Candidatus Ozemobacteraceae bacterium]
MAKVYKSFQVRIDPNNRLQIPGAPGSPDADSSSQGREKKTGQGVSRPWTPESIPRPPGPSEDEGEEDEGRPPEFKELPVDRLTGDGSGSSENDLHREEEHSSEEGKESETTRRTSPASGFLAARLSASLNAVKRRESELGELETRLREWENSVQAKEIGLDGEIAKLQAEAQARRQAMEQESARIIDMAKKSAENHVASGRAEADSLKKAAQIEADSLRKTVQLELDQARSRAEKEGYSIGEERGIAAGEKAGGEEMRLEWQSLMQETEQLINELQTSRIGILKSSEEEMVKLVIAFAKRVIKAECQTRPDLLLTNIETALNKIAAVDKIVLRINLRDKSMAESHKSDFLKKLSGVTELTILEDNALAPGGVKIETGAGTVDATIETQAEELERALLKVLNRPE